MLSAFLATTMAIINTHGKNNRTGISALGYATGMGLTEAINMLNEYHQRLVAEVNEMASLM
jgi:hypothetical protein